MSSRLESGWASERANPQDKEKPHAENARAAEHELERHEGKVPVRLGSHILQLVRICCLVGFLSMQRAVSHEY